VVIREHAAKTLRVRVLDRGKPVPFARLFVDIERGDCGPLRDLVQLPALYTNEHGELSIRFRDE
jgi:hypothetical protein